MTILSNVLSGVSKSVLSNVIFSLDDVIDIAEAFGDNMVSYITSNSTKTYSSGVELDTIVDEQGTTYNDWSSTRRMQYDDTAFGGYGGYASVNVEGDIERSQMFADVLFQERMVFAQVVRIPNNPEGSIRLVHPLSGTTVQQNIRLYYSLQFSDIFFADGTLPISVNDYWRGKDVVFVMDYKSATECDIYINDGNEPIATLSPTASFTGTFRLWFGGGFVDADDDTPTFFGDRIVANGTLADNGVTAKQVIASLASAHNLTPFIFPDLDDMFVSLNGGTPATWAGIDDAGDAITEPTLSDTPLDIIVAAGQSNMVASASGDFKNAVLDRAHPDVWVMEGDTLTIRGSEMPVDFRSDGNTSVTPAMPFARYYANNKLESGRKVLIICAAKTGTSLHTDWKKATGTLYDDMIDDINTALALNPDNRVTCVYWSQGESDRTQSNPQSTYETNFTDFIDDVRTDLSLPDLPFVCSGLNPNPYTDQVNADDINAAQIAVAAADDNVIYSGWNADEWGDGTKISVPNSGSDSVHFGGDANRVRGVVAGRAFVSAYDGLLSAPSITGVPTISGNTNVGEVLTVTPASVSGYQTPEKTYQWSRSGTPISGATSTTYTLVLADIGETITVTQTATNTSGSDTATSAATSAITDVFDPTGDNLVFWLDASDTATITNDSGRATDITDKKGSLVLSATGTERAFTGTRTLNSLNVLDFQGAQIMDNDILSINQPYTLFLVIDLDAAGTQVPIDGKSDRGILLLTPSGFTYNAGSSLTRGTRNLGYQIITIVCDGTSSEIYENNVLLGTAGNIGTDGLTGYSIGGTTNGSARYDGGFAEERIYNLVLSESQMDDVYAELETKWGTP